MSRRWVQIARRDDWHRRMAWASGDAMPDGHPYDPRETCGCRGPAACRERRARGECSRMVPGE